MIKSIYNNIKIFIINVKKKKTCLWVLQIQKIRDNGNEIRLKEGGRGIEMSTTVASIHYITIITNLVYRVTQSTKISTI